MRASGTSPRRRRSPTTRPPSARIKQSCVPERPEELWERALRTPRVPRELAPPVTEEQPRHGTGGTDCYRCEHGDSGALWSDGHWIVRAFAKPSGLPAVVLLESRGHHDFADLPHELALPPV